MRPLLLTLLLALGLNSGCLPIHHVSIDRSFDGLGQKLAETSSQKGTLRVLIVHGMGIHPEGYSSQLVARVVSVANLEPCAPLERVEIRNGLRYYGALNIRAYASGLRKVTFYELTWSPTTEGIKWLQFQSDIQESQHRQIVNQALKGSLMDLSLSDSVLYAGKFRSQMQYPIEAAVKRILSEGVQNGDQVATVTFSLGSFMFFDTIKRMASETHDDKSTPENKSVKALIAHTSQIYMLANQLPLLELSDIDGSIGLKRAESMGSLPKVLQEFILLKNLSTSKLEGPRSVPTKFQIVAFSDPNDLLSYTLPKSKFPAVSGGITVETVNVNMTVETWSILGIVANPLVAHTGWDTDSRAVDFLTFGYDSQGGHRSTR